MIVCCCDGSVDGIFTAIYRAWEIGTSRTSISVTEGEDMELFSEYRFFEPDSSLAAKVASTIRSRLSPEIFSQVYHAAISGANDRGNVIYHFLIDAFKVGSGIVNHLVNPYVMRLSELDRNVRRESHNYLGFLRFEVLCLPASLRTIIFLTLYRIISPTASTMRTGSSLTPHETIAPYTTVEAADIFFQK